MIASAGRLTLFFSIVATQLMLFSGAPAHGHAAYEASDPSNEAQVESPPERVTVDFTEPVNSDSSLEVVDPCGIRVDDGEPVVAADRVSVTMSADKRGTYTVIFGVVSSVDGHPTNGKFTFSSTGGAECASDGPAEEEPSGPGGGKNGGGRAEGGSSAADPAPADAGETSKPTDGNSGEASNLAGRSQSKKDDNGSTGRSRDRERVRLSAQGRASEPVGRGAEGDLSAGRFLFAFGLAAVIGIGGGFIYNGLLGPNS